MFSHRIPWDSPPNQLTQALRLLRRSDPDLIDLIDLSESNPTRAALFPEGELDDLLRPLADPRGLAYAPDPRGLRAAREAIAAYYAERGLALDPDHLVLCASTSEAYAWIFQLLCDPGDAVLVPQPSYPLLGHLLGLCAARPLPYPLSYDGRWRIQLEELESLEEAARARALVLVSPNNPTGSFLHQDQWPRLDALCARRGLAVIADEVFGDFPLQPEPAQLRSLVQAEGAALRFVLSGLSKVLGLPQLKLGWIHVGGPEPLRARAQDRLELCADTFLSVGTPVQGAAAALLGQRGRLAGAIQRRVQGNHRLLQGAVAGTAAQLLHAEGGWYAVLRLPAVLSEEAWALRLLREDHVLCHPGYFFDLDRPGHAYLVLSLLPPALRFAEGVRRVLRRVAAEA